MYKFQFIVYTSTEVSNLYFFFSFRVTCEPSVANVSKIEQKRASNHCLASVSHPSQHCIYLNEKEKKLMKSTHKKDHDELEVTRKIKPNWIRLSLTFGCVYVSRRCSNVASVTTNYYYHNTCSMFEIYNDENRYSHVDEHRTAPAAIAADARATKKEQKEKAKNTSEEPNQHSSKMLCNNTIHHYHYCYYCVLCLCCGIVLNRR